MNLLSNISKMGTLEQYYAKFLVSVENLTTAFYKFMSQYNQIAKIMVDPTEFYKHEYPQEYVDAKTELENAILEYQQYINDAMYGIIRSTHLNVEFGYSAFRIVQTEKRIMSMIEGFNNAYTNKEMSDESYAYAGLSFLESEFNSISILIAKIVETFPIPRNNNEGENEETPNVEVSEIDPSEIDIIEDNTNAESYEDKESVTVPERRSAKVIDNKKANKKNIRPLTEA